jgi:alpha-amylase
MGPSRYHLCYRRVRVSEIVIRVIVATTAALVSQITIASAQSAPARAGIVQLFEWPWPDIAKECTTFLGPKRFWAVQVSPPNEHAQKPNEPWWQRYQPVSYELTSRSGNRQDFIAMVNACRDTGVGIIVDAVLNHMTADNGTSSTGNTYEKYRYPRYVPDDFHMPACLIGSNYKNRSAVQSCELGDVSGFLADLRTEKDKVRDLQASYLADLLNIGVIGFRLDAAKHMPSTDISKILARTSRLHNGPAPYVFSEVINCNTDEPITPAEYTSYGDVTEFKYGQRIGETFGSGQVARLLHREQSWDSWNLLESFDAVPFINNHDTMRGGPCSDSILTYKNGSTYNIAQVFAFAWPYGNLVMTSGYAFSHKHQGPPLPSGPNDGTGGPWRPGDISAPSGCDGAFPWVCEHRWGNIASMVGFRAATLGAWSVDNRWDNGFQQIAFSRGSLGFVAINNEDFGMDRELQTGMPAGKYCQVLSGDFNLGTRVCSGMTVDVRPDGITRVVLGPKNAFAIHVGSRTPWDVTSVGSTCSAISRSCALRAPWTQT